MNSADAANLHVYDRPDVAQHYADLRYLSPCEQLLFDRYIKAGMAVLDLGVGGGRTTPYLAQVAGRYVGVDYAAEMIRVCRGKFPDLEFIQRNAADLSCFAPASFDAIVITFNGLDYLSEPTRQQCLRECCRLLKDRGVLIFSSHNPRAILVRPAWNRERVRTLVRKFTRGNAFLTSSLILALSSAAALRALARATWSSSWRLIHRITTPTFWRGQGYLFDPAHGGLVTYCGTPACIVTDTERTGFHLLEVQGDDYPVASSRYVTAWYYYVFSKLDTVANGELCA